LDPIGDWTAWQVLVVVASVLGLGVALRWLLGETAKEYLGRNFPRRIARWMKGRDLPPAAGTHFTVLIADLKRDGDGSQTDHVAAALAPYKGVDVVRVGPGPEWDFGSRTTLEEQARRLVTDRRGDVLIFGEVAKADERLRLYLLGGHDHSETQFRSYALETAELPKDFGADFNAMLLAVVAAQVAPATEQAGQYLVDALRPAADRLTRLCEHLPDGLHDDQRGSLWHALGVAARVLGEQSGESELLKQAVEAYRAALEVRTRERVPLDWAQTQNNLGLALFTLGEREDGNARLEEAVAALRAALEVRTRERMPLDWAMTQNNLGSALRILGEREDGTVRLEQAVAACRAALEVYTRERVPLHWATAQNNLGHALSTLGEREDGTARLGQALEAHRAALEVFRSAGASYYVAGTERNLARAEVLLIEPRTRRGPPDRAT
jgi:tetratricopeptide (TPR) repeat protein